MAGRPVVEALEVGRRVRAVHPRAEDGGHVLAVPADAVPADLAEVDPAAPSRDAASLSIHPRPLGRYC